VVELAWSDLLLRDGYALYPAADELAISAAGAQLGHALPGDLADLYRASNGVFDKPGQWFVIWTLDTLVEQNLLGWADRLHPRELLMFGDDGTESSCGIDRDEGGEVVCWHPIEQWADPLAPNLKEFWRGWTAGTITT
jgi:hypothetical protein